MVDTQKRKKVLAKAAASASIPAIKGSVPLDSFDIKIIQYKNALYKLNELSRLLNVLVPHLKKKRDNDESYTIIPLVNFILSLCEGPIFNVSPVLAKRYHLLCRFQLVKLNDVQQRLSTNFIEVEGWMFPEDVPLDHYKSCIYNNSLQWKILNSLSCIAQNAISIYNAKLRQILLERDAYKARSLPFDTSIIEDLLNPVEMSLILDLAVLINDPIRDKSTYSFYKLQWQVMEKLNSCVHLKIFPILRTYFNQLQKFSETRPVSLPNLQKDLPHWEWTLHRIYTFQLRVFSVLCVIISLSRQVFLPNKRHFLDIKARLSSENTYHYDLIISELVALLSPESNDHTTLLELQEDLKFWTQTTLADNHLLRTPIFHLQPGLIIELFNNQISKIIPKLRCIMTLLSNWMDCWKYIEKNIKTFDDSDEDLQVLLKEKLERDKTMYLGRKNAKSRLKKKPSITKLSASPSPSPSPVSSASPSRQASLESIRTRARVHLASTSSRSRSPSLSPIRTNSNHKGVETKKAVVSPEKRRIVNGGRPRSSSLQSYTNKQQTTYLNSTRHPSIVPPQRPNSQRSNSLQASTMTLNQKIIQDTVRHLMNKPGSTSNSSTSSSLAPSPKISSISNSSSVKSSSTLTINGSDTLAIETLTLDPESGSGGVLIKRVRFAGVTPMTDAENPKPTKMGWYKKPAVLHYPPIPASAVIKPLQSKSRYNTLRQEEGFTFRKSLRDGLELENGESNSETTMMPFGIEIKESAGHRIASKIRSKLR
ncbi:protein phosphatase regulator GIP4 SKDI_01G0400 [Saccharomyces kudriavzevii IFO 1802]|uniref:GIP4-like protein n=1 Tax=Saccharomyces kudriavzevii (strain ATCC MYA-4449 / AS 2.2408 / CBS 8840 / NBRC 1802 / NCYC 2889) TaxID=226230 RepID=A0AA35NLX5_SACK1|nr:uncharacterized protein SKDI_01G0400 [Saccharomyces kudriavzevii IFO 1802]CAI4054496.1 hypothetical protein SKDI_01G0400 [Saccharomyces kudriavzevii IFO 1802]